MLNKSPQTLRKGRLPVILADVMWAGAAQLSHALPTRWTTTRSALLSG